ncbi:DUF5667 domain-containing protein [Chloroflexota bacterium]
MKKSPEFDNILNECLEAILTRGETVEECLARYPEQAAELQPLLETIVDARGATELVPRQEFQEKARHEFRMALRETEPQRGNWFPGWRPQWAVVPISILVLVFGGGGTVVAASGSLPDEPLYPVKRATETVRLALTPSALGKAELYAELIDRRVTEITDMAEKEKAAEVEKTTDLLSQQLITMANLVARGSGAAPTLEAPVPAVAEKGTPAVEQAPEVAAEEEPLLGTAPQAPQETPRGQVRKGPPSEYEEAEAPGVTTREAPEKPQPATATEGDTTKKDDQQKELKELQDCKIFYLPKNYYGKRRKKWSKLDTKNSMK